MKRTSVAIAISFALWISLTICFVYFLPRRVPDAALREHVNILNGALTAIVALYALGSVHILQKFATRSGIPKLSIKDIPEIVNTFSLKNGSLFEYIAAVLYVFLQIIVALWVTSIFMEAALNIYALFFK